MQVVSSLGCDSCKDRIRCVGYELELLKAIDCQPRVLSLIVKQTSMWLVQLPYVKTMANPDKQFWFSSGGIMNQNKHILYHYKKNYQIKTLPNKTKLRWKLRVSIPVPRACEARALPIELRSRCFDQYCFLYIKLEESQQTHSTMPVTRGTGI